MVDIVTDADWTPQPGEVKGLIPQRVGAGPFTDDTVPSYDEVVGLIDGIVTEVRGDVGAIPDDENLLRQARWAATLGAAYYVEAGFFPEQQDATVTSPAERLWNRYQAQLDRLRAAVEAFYSKQQGGGPQVGTIKMTSAVVADYQPGLLARRRCV